MELRRLLPEPGAVAAAEAYGSLDLAALAPAERPYVVCNFAATADGKATIAGRSGPIGDEADRELFHRLRTQVDAVLVGPETVRVERYGRLVRDPALREARVQAGLAADPLACLISRSGRFPLEAPLFQDPDSTIALYTGAPEDPGPTPARLRVTRIAPAELTPAAVLGHLRDEHGVRSVLCEGGPTLFGALVADRVVDELFLCLAPSLAGGGELGISAGPPLPAPEELALTGALERRGYLFLRYARPRAGP